MAATDLEALWAGPFGDAYTERNRNVGADRAAFWWAAREITKARTWLEVGCNVGANLRWLPPSGGFGVDVNRAALVEAADETPGRVVVASAAALPFLDGAFDAVFTCGTLIHIRRDLLLRVLREIGRVARRWVLLLEYDAPDQEVVPWRGQDAALWRAPYGPLFEELVPAFGYKAGAFLPPPTGFDNVTCWLFERKD